MQRLKNGTNGRVLIRALGLLTCFHLPISAQAPKIQLQVTETPIGKFGALQGGLVPDREWLAAQYRLRVSPNGVHIAYAHGSSGRDDLYIDNVKQEFPLVGARWPVFSDDGRRVAYESSSGGPWDRERFIIVDGVAGTRYEAPRKMLLQNALGRPTFGGPDGKRIAYSASNSAGSFVVTDGVDGKAYDQVGNPAFSPDGTKLAYGARRRGMWIMVGSVEEGKEKEYVRLGLPKFSPDGRLAFQAESKSGRRVVVDGVEGPRYSWTTAPRFSPDGRHVAYLASANGVFWQHSPASYTVSCGLKCVAVIDGVERPLNGAPAGFFAINNDGVLAYSYGKEGGKGSEIKAAVVVVDGKEVAEANWKGTGSTVGPVFFSPDGNRFAFRLVRPKNQNSNFNAVVIDGTEQPAYGEVGNPVFSPDSKHVVYFAWASGRTCLVVDGVELLDGPSLSALWGPHEEMWESGVLDGDWHISSPVRFVSSSVMEAVRFKGRDLSRIRMEIVTAER